MYWIRLIFFLCFTAFQSCQSQIQSNEKPGWPEIARETKPWARWWWHGNAQTKEGITAEMEAYQKAGLGGLEITPIYGVVGTEDKFVDYLSPQWMELLIHTLKEAERLNMGIDMATGTGWPFGGPWVSDEDASKDMNFKIFEVKGGTTLAEKIEFIQQPLLRAIGNPVFQSGNETQPTARLDPKKIDIKQLVDPISANKNLQGLAIDQIKFEKPLKLKVLMAYGSSNEIVDLTDRINASGKLDWTAPAGNWKLYAVFEGWHGKMVERAGPGGEGYAIDHFSAVALKHYLNRFDSAFAGKNIETLRAFFNDSYEVDDARGTANWTPTLFEEFQKLKGYDLREHLPALFGKDIEEKNKRILCDYRETIAELLLKNFTQQWKTWAHGKSAIVRNQAHGSPSNILDLYATVDIPEIEGTEPLRIRMAASAGNVTGKKLVSSESATWLNEHFQSNLGDIKVALDRFMLNGVNHTFYHGTCYSPPGEPWPGWLFYAAVHLNPRNPLWKDFGTLNNYVARCQSFLQNSVADNDVLLYYPVFDRFSAPGPEMIEHFDGIGKQFANTAFERVASTLLSQGYTFDYISDKQIEKTEFFNGTLKTEGNSLYKTIIVPHCQYIPLKTFEKIFSLAEAGATIIFAEGAPTTVSGFGNLDKDTKDFETLLKRLKGSGVTGIKVGKGLFLSGENISDELQRVPVLREAMVDQGIQFIRKKMNGGQGIYFMANDTDQSFEGWLPVNINVPFIVLYDPMNGDLGSARVREVKTGKWEVYVQLTARQTLFAETRKNKPEAGNFRYYTASRQPVNVVGKWTVKFLSGGPKLPPTVVKDTLSSWTNFGMKDYSAFSGTASYTVSFVKPAGDAKGWLLDLGVVDESAEVFINQKSLGTLIGPAYQLYFDSSILKENNQLEVRVTNLMANRIADMDRNNVYWKKFYNVNFAARKPENRKNGIFDASAWQPQSSGLLGPVEFIPVGK
ncbi:MAG TPA: glycosyl hydrolase [Cyclobacteriaceae bacterium]|nr:glycosyl hydrolase [Cyclobacteriaceae bacterium]